MQYFRLLGIFFLVAVTAFSLAISGLGEMGNALVFTAVAVGLLLIPANLTAARRRAGTTGPESSQESASSQA